jgi:hypothetical protein
MRLDCTVRMSAVRPRIRSPLTAVQYSWAPQLALALSPRRVYGRRTTRAPNAAAGNAVACRHNPATQEVHAADDWHRLPVRCFGGNSAQLPSPDCRHDLLQAIAFLVRSRVQTVRCLGTTWSVSAA